MDYGPSRRVPASYMVSARVPLVPARRDCQRDPAHGYHWQLAPSAILHAIPHKTLAGPDVSRLRDTPESGVHRDQWHSAASGTRRLDVAAPGSIVTANRLEMGSQLMPYSRGFEIVDNDGG